MKKYNVSVKISIICFVFSVILAGGTSVNASNVIEGFVENWEAEVVGITGDVTLSGKGDSAVHSVPVKLKLLKMIERRGSVLEDCKSLPLKGKIETINLRLERRHWINFFKPGDIIKVKYSCRTSFAALGPSVVTLWDYLPGDLPYEKIVGIKNVPSKDYASMEHVKKLYNLVYRRKGYTRHITAGPDTAGGFKIFWNYCKEPDMKISYLYKQDDLTIAVAFDKDVINIKNDADSVKKIFRFSVSPGYPKILQAKGWKIIYPFGDIEVSGKDMEYLVYKNGRLKGEMNLHIEGFESFNSGNPYCRAPRGYKSPAECHVGYKIPHTINLKFDLPLKLLKCSK